MLVLYLGYEVLVTFFFLVNSHKYHTKFHQLIHFSRNTKYPSHTSKEIVSLIRKRKDMDSKWIDDKKNFGSRIMIRLMIIDYMIN